GLEILAASQGVSKGLRQTEGPQLIARPEVAFGPVFIGGYYKNVTSTSADGEGAAAAGVRARVDGFDLVGSVMHKWAVGDQGPGDRDSFEFFASVSRRFGSVATRLNVTWSPDDLGGAESSLYVEAGATVALAGGLGAGANVSRRERDGATDYTAFNAGATYAVSRNLSADLRYYDTDRSGLGEIYESRLVASLRLRL
ncbi:MAG TPA: TorF family putative porin, partial [Allosphingosinicella sp.]